MPNKIETSKAYFWIILNVILVIAGIVLLLSAKALWHYGANVFPARTINISAEGKTVAAPDVANLSFSVVSEGKNPEQLQADNTAKINSTIEFIKSEGVEAKDIKTADYNLSPRYDYDEKTRRSFISGYTLTQTVFVKIRDLQKVGKIISGLPSRGINQISSLSFSIDDPDKYLNEARAEAFEKALAKAKEMAKQNHVRIKRVVTFNESGGGYPPMPYLREAAFGKGGDAGAPLPAPSIEPGTQEVIVQVNVTYEIW